MMRAIRVCAGRNRVIYLIASFVKNRNELGPRIPQLSQFKRRARSDNCGGRDTFGIRAELIRRTLLNSCARRSSCDFIARAYMRAIYTCNFFTLLRSFSPSPSPLDTAQVSSFLRKFNYRIARRARSPV